MFTESFYVHAQLNDIMETGQVSVVETIFVEFNDFLRGLGLDVLVTCYEVRSQFIAGQPSCMSIYLKTTSNINANQIDPDVHNWGGTHRYTNKTRDCWRELIKKYGFPESHAADQMHVDFYSFEEIYLNFLPRKSKVEVVQRINNELKGNRPDHVFCSSEPAYNIVFANEKMFSDNLNLGYFEKIRAICDDVLMKNDLFDYYKKGSLNLHFYHGEDKNVNLYGLSRED